MAVTSLGWWKMPWKQQRVFSDDEKIHIGFKKFGRDDES